MEIEQIMAVVNQYLPAIAAILTSIVTIIVGVNKIITLSKGTVSELAEQNKKVRQELSEIKNGNKETKEQLKAVLKENVELKKTLNELYKNPSRKAKIHESK